MDESEFQRKEYAPSTEVHIVRAETYWLRYCEVVLQGSDPWYLDLRANKNGKRKPPVKSRQSLTTFWCNFRLAVERAVNVKVNKLIDVSLVRNGLAHLGKIYKLKTDKTMNREMTMDGLKRQIETTLCTPEKSFILGELRILAVLFLLLVAPAGSRPASILKLRFRHLRISLNRDPEDPNGYPRLLIQLHLEFTKQYLGPKAT
ncbi:putative c2h2 finger domain protein [Diaporthe ampelina]|uniref:Putative c2h2 finger domain protein n=1 Tax=Diaporthe ampelina TaxID=1214573 RepID=A0A0G2F523_9PEZI|nr:putative c2h2 finger domain protein [Diaporthe ampelina]